MKLYSRNLCIPVHVCGNKNYMRQCKDYCIKILAGVRSQDQRIQFANPTSLTPEKECHGQPIVPSNPDGVKVTAER